MATPPKETGYVMRELLQQLNDANSAAARRAAAHIRQRYTNEADYQAALGDVLHQLLDMRPIIESAIEIVEKNRKE